MPLGCGLAIGHKKIARRMTPWPVRLPGRGFSLRAEAKMQFKCAGRPQCRVPRGSTRAVPGSGRERTSHFASRRPDCVAGQLGFEPANPSARYLIGIT
jgi:hypothetical protein